MVGSTYILRTQLEEATAKAAFLFSKGVTEEQVLF
jgi:hypothetical protein